MNRFYRFRVTTVKKQLNSLRDCVRVRLLTSGDSNKNRLYQNFFDFNNKELWTVPNVITISRILASPLLAYTIYSDLKQESLIGCVVFAFSDWLDGYIAKNYNQATVLGSCLDPIADKFIIASMSLGLALKDMIPLPLIAVYIGRDVFLIGASFYIRYKEKATDAPFFDTTYSATFQIAPSELSKANTGLQFTMLSLTMCQFAFGTPDTVYIEPLWWITTVTTLGSGIGYLDGSGLKKI